MNKIKIIVQVGQLDFQRSFSGAGGCPGLDRGPEPLQQRPQVRRIHHRWEGTGEGNK